MNALILAAGLGTRLQGIAADTPKPMMEIGGSPLLHLLIEKLLKLGVEAIVINTHHKHEVIEKFIANQSYRAKIHLIYEEELLGTAGTLKANIDFLSSSDFLVLHGDNYFDDDLEAFLNAHKRTSEKIALSMGTFITANPESCGIVICDENRVVIQFHEKEKNSPSREANSAIYIMKPIIAETVRNLSDSENDISRDLIPKLLGQIYAFPFSGNFIDIGTPETLAAAKKLALS